MRCNQGQQCHSNHIDEEQQKKLFCASHLASCIYVQWFSLAPIMQSKSDFNLNVAVMRLNCDFCWCGTKKRLSKFQLNTKSVRTDYCKSFNELTASAFHSDFHRPHEMHTSICFFVYFMQPFNIFRMNAKCWKVTVNRNKTKNNEKKIRLV